MNAIVIRPDASIEIVDLPTSNDDVSRDALYAILDGWLESVPVLGRTHDLTMYINEDGKFDCVDEHGQPLVNAIATTMLHVGVPRLHIQPQCLHPTDFIAGPAILLGFDPETGCALDVPSDIHAWFDTILALRADLRRDLPQL